MVGLLVSLEVLCRNCDAPPAIAWRSCRREGALDAKGECSLAQILQFERPENVFDTDATAALVSACEQAIKSLNGTGRPELVREIIARKIIDAATKGERDPLRLSASALAAIGVQAQ